MSNWEDLSILDRVTQVLEAVQYENPQHHFGRPFLTAYQLAIAVDELDPSIRQHLELPLGGKGTSQKTSFTQYLAGQLSQRIASGEIPNIEGGFLSNRYLARIVLRHGAVEVESSLTESQWDVSVFRLHQ